MVIMFLRPKSGEGLALGHLPSDIALSWCLGLGLVQVNGYMSWSLDLYGFDNILGHRIGHSIYFTTCTPNEMLQLEGL